MDIEVQDSDVIEKDEDTAEEDRSDNLNGSCVNLGSFKDIKNSSRSRNESIKFIYYYKDQQIRHANG